MEQDTEASSWNKEHPEHGEAAQRKPMPLIPALCMVLALAYDNRIEDTEGDEFLEQEQKDQDRALERIQALYVELLDKGVGKE